MEEEFRPLFGRVLTVVVAVVGVAIVLFIAATSGVVDAVLTAPWAALFAVLCWAFYWHPCVVVSDGGVRLVNVLRTVDLPWPAIIAIETKYALTLVTHYGSFSAWAAPAPSAGAALRAASRSRRASGTDGRAVSRGEVPGTPSGDAATVVRRRWTQVRDAGHLDDPRLEFDAPPTTWHWQIALSVAGLTVMAVVSLLVS